MIQETKCKRERRELPPLDDYIFVPDIRTAPDTDMKDIPAYVIGKEIKPLSLAIEPLTEEEKEIIRCGSLINYNRKQKKCI